MKIKWICEMCKEEGEIFIKGKYKDDKKKIFKMICAEHKNVHPSCQELTKGSCLTH
ncbi:hypothetical protein KKA23_00860 [Patescibacteria group bacterium]|nr:hypothetical protein [Patescibacteria group bacterium]